tara:strand:- start:277 stop:702 length:426 start_codon:yes stop_codon:yes gene_type:complete
MNDTIIEWSPSDMLEVSLNEPDDFLKIKETLTRIGVASQKEENTLFQSCHILHKQGHYFITHFKELFALDGKPSTLTQNDLARRNTIASLLSDWGLLDIISDNLKEHASLKEIKIISHRDKADWNLESKYTIGNAKGRAYS